MKVTEIIGKALFENLAENDPEFEVVTLLDAYKAQEGIDQVSFMEFLEGFIELGYDVDVPWLEEVLQRKKDEGIVADFSAEEDYITLDNTYVPSSEEEDEDGEEGEDGTDDGDDAEEEDPAAKDVQQMASKQIAKKMNKK